MDVLIKQGSLRGGIFKSILTGKQFYGFLGIPYGKPPVGSLRFQDPEPLEHWEGILDATKDKSFCIQLDIFESKTIAGSEDCLYVNVYTPEPPRKRETPKAVMVFIHGGGFYFGSGNSNLHSPDFLINYDVILVTINYRLHILGFLNLNLPECRGNAGLKDQTLALKWVKENICEFGGDPENVTIFGESAGAGCVSYHTISPLSQGLFNRCIMQSGNAFCPWAFGSSSDKTAFKVGRCFGYNGNDPKELISVLRKVPAEKLTDIVNKIRDQIAKKELTNFQRYQFIPSVELVKEGAFLPDSPQNLLKVAKPIPIIAGVNNKEGLIYFTDCFDAIIKSLQTDFSIFVKQNVSQDPNLISKISDKIKHFYFENKSVSAETIYELADLNSDVVYYKTLYQFIDVLLKRHSSPPIYTYLFSYDGGLNFYKTFPSAGVQKTVPIVLQGASHGDELGYLFHIKIVPNPTFSEQDKNVIKHICTLWTNFAKTGDPNGLNKDSIQWNPTTLNQPSYLEIDENLQTKQGRIAEDRISFWENLL